MIHHNSPLHSRPSATTADLFDAIRSRRAVKQYDVHHSMSDDELRTLLSAAAAAPTAFNLHNKHFVAVTGDEAKARLQTAANGQQQVRDASVAIVLTGDLGAQQRPEHYLRDAPDDVRERMAPMVEEIYRDQRDQLRDEALRSVGLAAMSLMLAARALGYDSCPMSGFDPEAVSEVLGLDADHPPLLIVVVGKAAAAPFPRLGLPRLEEAVSIDRFGNHALGGDVLASLDDPV